LNDFLSAHPEHAGTTAISLETAHPAKFPEEIRELLGLDPDLPPSLRGLDGKPEHYIEIDTDYASFKDVLIREYRS